MIWINIIGWFSLSLPIELINSSNNRVLYSFIKLPRAWTKGTIPVSIVKHSSIKRNNIKLTTSHNTTATTSKENSSTYPHSLYQITSHNFKLNFHRKVKVKAKYTAKYVARSLWAHKLTNSTLTLTNTNLIEKHFFIITIKANLHHCQSFNWSLIPSPNKSAPSVPHPSQKTI